MELIELHIKNMVCPRCEMAVRQILDSLNVNHHQVELGRAIIEAVDSKTLNSIHQKLKAMGFDLLKNQAGRVVEQVKIECHHYLKNLEEQILITNLSQYLAAQLGINYCHLSKVFSKYEGQTLEAYFLTIKIKRVKSLLIEGELSLSEIAVRLKYSSVQYLSTQFRKIEGYTVSEFLKTKKIA